MFSFKYIMKALIIPPGAIFLLLLILNSWHLMKKIKYIGIYNITIACIIWLISMPPISNCMLRFLESDYQFIENPQADVIIVLNERFLTSVSDFSGVGSPSPLMLARMLTAARLQKTLNVPIILSYGVSVKDESSASTIAKRYFAEFGVSHKNIIIEKKSRDTFENAKNSKNLCKNMGFKKPIIVTSAYHLKRSILSFEKVGMHVTPFPSNFLSSENRDYEWYSLFPSYDSLNNSSIAIKEYFGLIFYKFFY